MAINFNGSTEYIDHGNNTALDYNVPFSAVAWVNADTMSSEGILTKTDPASPYQGWAMAIYDVGGSNYRLELKLINSWTANVLQVSSLSGTVGIGTDYHVGFSYDGSTNASGVTFYVNGSSVTKNAADKDTLTGTIITANPLRVGDAITTSQRFDGEIWDGRVYSRELAAEEFKIIYEHKGNDGIANGLIFRTRADELAEGSTVTGTTDISVNGFDGSPVNSPAYTAKPMRIG